MTAAQAANTPAATINAPCGTPLTNLHPADGSTLALQRGCTAYSGTLRLTASDVTVTAYGTGNNPLLTLRRNGASIDISGSNNTIENLTLVGSGSGSWLCGGRRTPAGHVDGIDIEAGADDNTVIGISASGFYAGVFVMAESTGNVIENSTFTNNNMLNTNDALGSSGAFGVLLWGDNNTVTGNSISGSQACSIAYGSDGSAVEVYGGSNNLISSNHAANNNAFTELGSYSGSTATSNTYRGNVVSDGSSSGGSTFLVTRGSADQDGPVYRTIVTNNTVNLTRPGDEGVISYAWRPSDGTLITLTGNYLNVGPSNQVLYEDGGYVNGGGNTFIGSCNPSSGC
ncbi:MAG TPA: hypothetical protein VFI65_03425 [Streptosporangiaceae bacterium]|nr:hypothetical protein [Streptosporangiaceae bacterium]